MEYGTQRKQLSNEGPRLDEIELIGIELAVTNNGGREIELEMHGIKRILPYLSYDRNIMRVTVHTSNGDITMRCPMAPGNYQGY